jgi:magnesium-transporting ATPase (P-type)
MGAREVSFLDSRSWRASVNGRLGLLSATSPQTPALDHKSARDYYWSVGTAEWSDSTKLIDWKVINMGALLVIIAIVAIVLLFIGGFVQAVQWLLWVGIILLVIAVIAWLLRLISGRRNTSL